MNLSDFEHLEFTAKLDPVSERLPADAKVWLELGCRELREKDPLVRAQFAPNTNLGSFELQLSKFDEPVLPTQGFREECLARVDQVCAVVERSATEHTSAELVLDHVVLR